MAAPQPLSNSLWWNNFRLAHKSPTGTLESAFTGYLVTQNIPALSVESTVLDSAYTAFLTWWGAMPLPQDVQGDAP